MTAPAEALLGDNDDVILAQRKRRSNPERAIAAAILQWLQLAIPGAVAWAAPNEVPYQADSKRAGWAMMAARRAAGMRKGAPDLTIAIPGRVVFLEVKSPRGVLSTEQGDFHARLARIGHKVWIVRSVDDARAVFQQYGAVK